MDSFCVQFLYSFTGGHCSVAWWGHDMNSAILQTMHHGAEVQQSPWHYIFVGVVCVVFVIINGDTAFK